MKYSLLLLSCLLLTETLFAQEIVPDFAPRKYVCYQADEALLVDGKLDEAAWQAVPWTENFMDIEGESKPLPRLRTRAKMLWDEQYFYFAAELEEPHIWANLRQRDTVIFYDNDFEIFIDPDGDSHRYYEFEMNAFNTLWDLLLITPYRDGENAVLNSWDIRGIKSGVDIIGTINDPSDTDTKWTVEIAMPWEVLKEQAPGHRKPEAGEYWRVNFSRVQWQTDIVDGRYVKRNDPQTGKRLREDNWVWSPQGAINMHRPETWGFVVFSAQAAASGGESFEIPASEYTKWELRKLYYAQRDYFRQHAAYASELQDLAVTIPETAEISAGDRFYLISMPEKSSDTRWYIDEQGRTWSSVK